MLKYLALVVFALSLIALMIGIYVGDVWAILGGFGGTLSGIYLTHYATEKQ